MKIVHIETLISIGDFAESIQWFTIRDDLLSAIRLVDWPPGNGSFVIYPEYGKARGKGNGVTPIKNGLIKELHNKGWELEQPLRINSLGSSTGKLDAVLYTPFGPVAFEWETGNISSSHRALNKMSLGLIKSVLAAGILVVPSRNLYKYLTDRIGNYTELIPYLDLWKSINCQSGILEIIVIEHDGVSLSVPRIPKGISGRAIE